MDTARATMNDEDDRTVTRAGWRRAGWRRGLGLGLLLVGCTEPNPYLSRFQTDTEASTGETSGGVTPTTGGTTVGDPDSGSSGTSSACEAAGMACIESAPEGWLGPFAWMERSAEVEPVSCAPPWDQPLVEAFSDIFAPAARCTCECGPYGAGSCGSASVIHYQGAGCMGAVEDSLELSPMCNELAPAWGSLGSFWFEAPVTEGGGCVPVLSAMMQDASFLSRHLACGGGLVSLDCGPGRQCASTPGEPFYPRWCIAQLTEADCPAGPYTERERLYRALEDDRDCEPCSCSPPMQTCLGASAVLSTLDQCMIVDTPLVSNGCVEGPGGASFVGIGYSPGAALGQCTPSAAVPSGEAAGIEPVTFCCTR
jgi:hypothetical protein